VPAGATLVCLTANEGASE